MFFQYRAAPLEAIETKVCVLVCLVKILTWFHFSCKWISAPNISSCPPRLRMTSISISPKNQSISSHVLYFFVSYWIIFFFKNVHVGHHIIMLMKTVWPLQLNINFTYKYLSHKETILKKNYKLPHIHTGDTASVFFKKNDTVVKDCRCAM